MRKCKNRVRVFYSDVLFQLYVFFFFFQEEDGIRFLTVTGVQTCALPISLPAVGALLRGEPVPMSGREVHLEGVQLVPPPAVVPPLFAAAVRDRKSVV